VNTTGESTRNIAGLTGFAAVQKNTEAPVLQLTDLHGDIVATASLSETATALASTTDTSEFGVPTTSTPPKYSWLGADEIPTELPSGVLDMGARSYVPQLGRFLQPDPQSGGSANAYTYTFGDPVNSADPSGEYTVGGPSQALIDGTAQMASEAAAQQAAENAAARAEAERKAREAEEAAAAASGPQQEGEAGPLGGSAGWACEYAEETGQGGCGGGGEGFTVSSLVGEESPWLEHHCQVGQLYFGKKCVQSRPPIVPKKPPNHPSGPNRQKESCGFLGFCPIISGERE
jgi:RHS repeat-associated protein